MELNEKEKKTVKNIINQYLLEAKSKEHPIIHFLVAPPGAGKTGMEIFLKNKFKNSGDSVAVVGSDKLATYHPDYEEWLQLPPDECYRISREFTNPASDIVYEKLRKEKVNIIFEKTFHKGVEDLEFVKKFKDAGYNVEINVMATDKYESILSCHERDIKAAEIGVVPRPVSRKNFDKMYNTFLSEIITMEKFGLCDSINVYTRGKRISEPNLAYTTSSEEPKYLNVYEAVNSERAMQRKKLLTHEASITFLERIGKAKDGINNVIDNQAIRKESLTDLENLRKEFLQEAILDQQR